MPTPIMQAILLLIDTLFSLYILVLMLRLILGWMSAHYFDPIVQFVVRLTSGIINPLRKFIPNAGRLEVSTLIVMILLVNLKIFILSFIQQMALNPITIFILSIADLLQLYIYIMIAALVLNIIMSWINVYNPLSFLTQRITAPLLRPIQRVLPPINGIDLSPIPAFIFLQLLTILLVNPLRELAFSFMG